MRKIVIILLAVSMLFTFASCGEEKKLTSDKFEYVEETDAEKEMTDEFEAEFETAAETDAETEPETETATDMLTKTEPMSDVQSYQRIGDEFYGYIDVPADWVEFNEIGMEDQDMIQYSDSAGESVVTMQYVEEVDAETAATNIYSSLEGQCEGLTAAMVELGGFEAYQVYCFYPDTAEFLVCWLFDGDDGFAHYIAIEGTDMAVFDLSETYSLYE